MRQSFAVMISIAAVLSLSGCVANTLASVVTAPVRVVSKTVDLATTSQSEADEKRGREVRLEERRLGRIERSYRDHSRDCSAGDDDACRRAEADYAQMQQQSRPYYGRSE